MIRLKAGGLDISARMPTLAELQNVREADGSAESFKALARSCVVSPPFAEIMRTKPALGARIGEAVLRGCGAGAELTILSEDEIPDGQMAEGYAEAQRKGFGALHAIQVTAGGEDLELILREPREVEVDVYSKAETVQAAKLLVDKITVWGAKGFEAKAPGLYLALSKYILGVVGLNESVIVGEA